MDKIKLKGGAFGSITLQGDSLPNSRLYISGRLYIWNKTLDEKNYRVFEYHSIQAFDE